MNELTTVQKNYFLFNLLTLTQQTTMNELTTVEMEYLDLLLLLLRLLNLFLGLGLSGVSFTGGRKRNELDEAEGGG